MPAAATLAADQKTLTLDAGLYKPITIGDLAFEDRNGNGVRDAGEAGVAGVGVKLVNDLTGATFTTVTAADGSYAFTVLPPGTYMRSSPGPRAGSSPRAAPAPRRPTATRTPPPASRPPSASPRARPT